MGNRITSKQQMAYERIKEAILTERYKEDQLLSTRELSDEYGISRTPVMHALRRLAYEGFIDEIPGKGMFVSRVRIEDFMELSEIKLGLESMAARLCAIRRTDRIIKEMEEALLQYEKEFKKGNLANCVKKDREFHMLIITGAKNIRMANILQTIIEQCSRIAYSVSNEDRVERIKTAIMPAHLKIFNAIVDGDPDRAEISMKEHIKDVADYFSHCQLRIPYAIKYI